MSDKPYMIGVAGPSCSGKTVLAKELKRRLSAETIVIGMDSYYRDLSALDPADREKHNFDAPESLDWELLTAQMQSLAQGIEIEKPVYGFSTHTRTDRTEKLVPREFVVIEGLFALYNGEVRKLLGTKVFIEAGDEVCLERRIERDMRERRRTRESVIAQYDGTVRPMYLRHVYPTSSHADIIVSGEDALKNSAASVIAHIRKRT